MNFLIIGDVVGRTGRIALQNNLTVFPTHQYRFNRCIQRVKHGISYRKEDGERDFVRLLFGAISLLFCLRVFFFDILSN